jgi:formate dehydrogenase subunit gamma
MPLDLSDDRIRVEAREIAEALQGLEGPLLPILHALQDRFGHVPGVAIPVVAEVLNLTRADVHGVVSFYHDFRDAPAGRHVLRICRSEACKSMGADRLLAEVEDALGISAGETTPDGRVTLEAVHCLGLCACAPAAQAGGRLVGRAEARGLVAGVSA